MNSNCIEMAEGGENHINIKLSATNQSHYCLVYRMIQLWSNVRERALSKSFRWIVYASF